MFKSHLHLAQVCLLSACHNATDFCSSNIFPLLIVKTATSVGSGTAFSTSAPPQNLFGNGEWPGSDTTDPSSSIARPPAAEFTDFNPKRAYKMESKPRGMAVIINNRHFTCGMKERVGEYLY